MFGEGYAGAQDRLFLMDILRHTGRAAALLVHRRLALQPRHGPRPVAARALHRAGPPVADRPGRRVLRRRGRAAGQRRPRTSSPGSTPTSTRRSRTRSLMPSEYAALGKRPQPWKPTDVIAEASLIGGIFGKGGGSELELGPADAGVREALRRSRPEGAPGRDFRSKNDPEAPTTVRARFPYETASAFAEAGPRAARPRVCEAGAGGSPGSEPARRRAERGRLRPRRRAADAGTQTCRTPPTGSWSRRASRGPATRSGCSGRRSATTCRRS